ncbi:MAG: aminoacetone oxidase family FAD-binding enzyme, partial [Acutalibacteraceae bacterium]
MNTLKISVIGGGASGLFYAVTAADLLLKNKIKAEISIIEKEQKLGRKLLATGNGRCNLTNTNVCREHYRGSFAYFSESIFAEYDCNRILKLFGALGLYCTEDTEGRVYPYSHQASAVLDCLILKINSYDFIKLKLGTRVKSITKHNEKYIINCGDETLESDIAVIACGGMASPSLGSDGSIFAMLKSLGIDISQPFPSLCPIEVTDKVLKSLKGIRCKCRASLIV